MTFAELPTSALKVVSLFSGIAGGDLGLERAGHSVIEMCESWEPARRVLAKHYLGINVAPDVRTYMPSTDFGLLAAGFPCVDLSHAGTQQGIFGPQSGLVEHVFRIARETRPEWIQIENVPNLLRLHKGAGIRYIIDSVESLGYRWAYRVLDSRAFGVAQRRNRVIFLASLTGDPASVLLGEDAPSNMDADAISPARASGFYWTEGRRGVGLVGDAIPTLKGGSTLGLPSAPAVWLPNSPVGQRIVLPSIEDAEVLQGFERGWTAVADVPSEVSNRWKLVGNAITVGLARWLGDRLLLRTSLPEFSVPAEVRDDARPWPSAAFGSDGRVWSALVSKLPRQVSGPPLDQVIDLDAARPLSYRATKGFLSRIEESGLPLPARFMSDLESHLSSMRQSIDEAKSPAQSWAGSAGAPSRIQNTKLKNTTPEGRLRRALSDRGLRYRLQLRPIPDLRWRSDIVFKGVKIAVEVRRCFWHVCPIHQTWPEANAERWATKLVKNQERDLRMEDDLSRLGWQVVVVWEHEDSEAAAARIERIVAERRPRSRVTHEVEEIAVG